MVSYGLNTCSIQRLLAPSQLNAALTRESSYAYFLRAYPQVLLLSLSRANVNKNDLWALLILACAPLLYFLRYKGPFSTPIGKFVITGQDTLRASVYGFFKTYFCYLRTLNRILGSEAEFDTVVDVGANVGDFTMATAQRSKRLVAVEPGRANVKALRLNIQSNGIEHVEVQNLAAHHREETLHLRGIGAGIHVVDECGDETVDAKPLDMILEQLKISCADVLKIDVNGHERMVIEGLQSRLGLKRVKTIVVEVHLNHVSAGHIISLDYIIPLVESFGYLLVATDSYLFRQPHLYFSSEPKFHV